MTKRAGKSANKSSTKPAGKKRAGKERADVALVARSLVESRSKAAAMIMAGVVFSGERRIEKAGDMIAEDQPLRIKQPAHPWVGRGGIKLAHALEHFGLKPDGLIAIDVGASTGGFTDVVLQNGAAKVYAVDVGYGQLAQKIRDDERVVVMERTNARNLGADDVPGPIGAIVCDASFIGLRTVLPASLKLAAPGCWLVALIKPQFEVGPARVGKGGIVRDEVARTEACDNIERWLVGLPGWTVLGITQSAITGADGNIEFLIAARFESEAGS
jgi:23S rRNA (cytidine1920-2'-O)/16S rRNA (cytidine1409-2'-O)-methyltransferase